MEKKCVLCNNQIHTDQAFKIGNGEIEAISCGRCFMLIRIFETLQNIKNVLGEETQNGDN